MVAGVYAIGGSEQGDIILSSGGKKKSKKIVITIAATVLIVAVLLSVILFMFFKNNANQEAKESLRDFVNYMLFDQSQENNDTESDELVAGDVYFEDIAESGSYDVQNIFWREAEKRLKAIKGVNLNTGAASIVDELKNILPVFEKSSEVAYTSVLPLKYLENNEFGIQNYINELNDVELASIEWVNGLRNMMRVFAEESQKAFLEFSIAGCVRDNRFNDECVTNLIDNNASLSATQNDIDSLRINIRQSNEMLSLVIFNYLKELYKDMENA